MSFPVRDVCTQNAQKTDLLYTSPKKLPFLTSFLWMCANRIHIMAIYCTNPLGNCPSKRDQSPYISRSDAGK